jgi:WD40 repeat protein
MFKRYIFLACSIALSVHLFAQDSLQIQITNLKRSELSQSISLRSLLIPNYFPELKALTARQAYNFWVENTGDKLVSHLNVYAALHDANKYIGFDSVRNVAYNQIMGHGDLVVAIEFGKKANTFYSAGSDGRVLQWNLNNLDQPEKVLYQGDELFRSIDISFDDQWLLAVTKQAGIILINLEQAADQRGIKIENAPTAITRDRAPVQTATFMPNSTEYLSITKEGELRLKGFKLDTLKATTSKQVRTMTVSDQTKKVYAGTDEGVVQMWDADMDESFLEIPELHRINALSISPNKTMLAIGREKGDAIIWDLQNEQLIRTIAGHQSAIMDLDFSPDNQLLLTASRDGTSRVFEINNPRKLPMVFDDHNDWVMTATFDHSGKRAITGSKDGFIRIWELDAQVLADRICSYLTREMSESEWKDFIGSGIPMQPTCK